MKNITQIIIFCLAITCNSQSIVHYGTGVHGDLDNKYFKDINNKFANFTGTWENTTGNITFRVTLWKEEMVQLITETNCFQDEIHGSYKIIQNAGLPNEVVLHNSVKYYAANGYTSLSIINIGSKSGIGAGGSIDDNCTLPAESQLGGRLRMQITNPGQTPSIAQWTVKRDGPRRLEDPVFTVPIDIILTKIN